MFSRRSVTVTAGEVEHHTWCAVCQAPMRLRVPLIQRGQQVATLEVCPGCGSGHDRAYAGVTPAPRTHPLPSLPRLARSLHGWRCRRKSRPALECAHGDCPWPGLWRNVLEMDGDDGTWKFLFCTRRHRSHWAREHGLGEGVRA